MIARIGHSVRRHRISACAEQINPGVQRGTTCYAPSHHGRPRASRAHRRRRGTAWTDTPLDFPVSLPVSIRGQHTATGRFSPSLTGSSRGWCSRVRLRVSHCLILSNWGVVDPWPRLDTGGCSSRLTVGLTEPASPGAKHPKHPEPGARGLGFCTKCRQIERGGTERAEQTALGVARARPWSG